MMDEESYHTKSVGMIQSTTPTITRNPVFRDQKSCHLRWSNVTKAVELKDLSVGLIKSSIGDENKKDKKVKTEDSTNRNEQQPSNLPLSNQKIILNQVSGEVRSGRILALMGPSGSGKTSLLDTLSSRSIYQDGTIFLNEHTVTNDTNQLKKLKRRTAYIKQQDIFFDHLTVKDQLTYTAFLRLGDDYTKEQKNNEVDKIISLLRLEKCQDTPIQLVSGGERKRVNIGTELLTNPSIIMLDEPTSGLDSTSATALIDLLVSLAHDHGKTIITSIHQPSSSIFMKFDNVMFLADGCMVYYGTPKSSLEYCKKVEYPCPDGYNAADHWMDLLVEDSSIPEKNSDNCVGSDSSEHQALLRSNDQSPFPITTESSADIEIGSGSDTTTGSATGSGSTQPNTIGGFDSSPKSTEVTLDRGLKRRGISKLMNRVKITDKETMFSLIDETKRKREEYRLKFTSKAKLITAWDNETFAANMNGHLRSDGNQHSSRDLKGMSGGDGDTADDIPEKKFNTSWNTQFHVLLHRSLKNSRAAILTQMNLFKSVALAIFTGLLWFQMPNNELHVNDRVSFLFFSSTYWVFEGTFHAIFSFPHERDIIFKERASGSYHLSAYFMAKTLSELPSRLVLPAIFWTITYWMTGINSSFCVFLFVVLVNLLSVVAGESYGLLCGAAVMEFEKAMSLMIVISLTTMAAGGYYIQNIPSWLSWLEYVSPFKFGYEASLIFVFQGNDVMCDGSGNLADLCTAGISYASSEDVLDSLGSEVTVRFCILILFIQMILPRYLAFLALKSKRGDERS